MGRKFFGWITGVALALGGSGVLACAFHGYTPNPTLVDVLLATEQVAVGRPVPGQPGRFVPVQILAGPEVSEIEIPPGWRIDAGQDAQVLLARDGAYGHWLALAVMDERFVQVVNHVMARQSDWVYGNDGPRVAYFARLVNDPNAALRKLALQELDRVPYSTLRGARLPQVQGLRQSLQSGDPDLRPIRVLLAGLSADRRYSGYLAEELEGAVRQDRPYLGAYATALIELEGKAGVARIFERYLEADELPAVVKERLLQALALQYRNGPRSTRRMIGREVAALSRRSPEVAEIAVRHFGSGSRFRTPLQSDQGFVLER